MNERVDKLNSLKTNIKFESKKTRIKEIQNIMEGEDIWSNWEYSQKLNKEF